jgi:hypothetical protein
MYESHHEPVLSRPAFLRRLRRHGGLALAFVIGSLAIGMAGFHWLADEAWIDAYLDSTMLLGGMGPVGKYDCCPAGKLFAGVYALYSGVAFLGASALFLAPLLHRIVHKLRLSERRSGR